MEGLDKEFKRVKDELTTQISDIKQIVSHLQTNLERQLTNYVDPRSRVGIAELLQSYAQLHRVLLDLNKQLVDIPEKALTIKRKEKELTMDTDTASINILQLQKVLHQIGIPIGLSIPSATQETYHQDSATTKD